MSSKLNSSVCYACIAWD